MSEKTKLLKRTSSNGYGAVSSKNVPDDLLPVSSTNFTKRDCIIVSVVLILAIVVIATTLALGLPVINEKRARYFDVSFFVSPSELKSFSSAAVVADAEPCADIGRNILGKGGSAVDAAVALLFCDGAVNPQSMGLGGGIFITVYTNATGVAEVFDGRESAPGAATPEMFVGNSTLLQSGPLSVAIPGELKAYWAVHQKHGKLPWSELVQPTIDLCKNGFPVGKHLEDKIQGKRSQLLNEPSLKEVFFNNDTQDLFKQGEIMKRPVLALTLEQIAQNGADEFYNGAIGKKFVEDLANMGGIMTEDDLHSYKVHEKPASRSTLLGDHVLYSVPPPGSGPVLSLILGIMDGYGYSALNNSQGIDEAALMYHRFVEALKFAYAKRTYLGDEEFVNVTEIASQMLTKDYADSLRAKISDVKTHEPEFYEPVSLTVDNEGTAQVSVLAPNGDAVSATSTVNGYFGAMLRSPSTGIIMNNGMDDFSVENSSNSFGLQWSPANLIAPHKRPLSSMCPTIITDAKGNVHTVFGGAGGSRITSGSALILFRTLYLMQSIKEAIDSQRIHHQLYPNQILYEKGFPQAILDKLEALGHTIVRETHDTAFQGIQRLPNGTITANMDYRKGGSVAGI